MMPAGAPYYVYTNHVEGTPTPGFTLTINGSHARRDEGVHPTGCNPNATEAHSVPVPLELVNRLADGYSVLKDKRWPDPKPAILGGVHEAIYLVVGDALNPGIVANPGDSAEKHQAISDLVSPILQLFV